MPENNLEATSFDSKQMTNEAEVDALIAGALKELDTTKAEEKGAKGFQATKMAPQEPIKKPEQKIEQKTEPRPEEKSIPKDDQAYEKTFKDFKVGGIVTGTIVRIDPSGALVDISYKSDGFIESSELPPDSKIGSRINAMIEKLESKEGYVLLSKKKADFELKWHEAFDAYRNKTILEAKVTGAVKGGLVAEFDGMKGFIPASQVIKKAETSLEEFVKKTLPVKIIEINRRQGKVVFSHKLAASEHERKESAKLIEELEVGQVRKGIVKNLKNFGAFVDLGGIEGLIPISELSWKRVKHPSDILKSGQEIDVFVIGVDKIANKVSLGLKQLEQDPWSVAAEKYKTGQVVKAKVLRLAKFGAFVEIEEGLEGLIHLSELSKDRIEKPEQVVKPGDIVDVKILRILPDEQKIGLSIKDVVIAKEKKLMEEQKKEESKVTIGEMIAQKEKMKAERDAEIESDASQNLDQA